MNPLPYSTSERAAGLATGPQVRYLAGNEDLLPMALGDGADLLPAVQDAPVVRIGPQPANDAPAYTVERREAIHTATVETSVTVPALQAALTAVSVGIMAGLLAWAFAWSWRFVAVVLALGLALGWLWRLRVADSLLMRVETLSGLDLNHDGHIGAASPAHSFTVANPQQARQTVATESKQQAESAEREAMQAFVDKCFTAGTSEAAHGIKAGGPDRNEFIRKRDVLLSLGIGKWRNPERQRAGWELACSHQRARQLIEKHVL